MLSSNRMLRGDRSMLSSNRTLRGNRSMLSSNRNLPAAIVAETWRAIAKTRAVIQLRGARYL
jgi:hypothetical protein